MIRKLKIENEEIRKLAEALQKKNLALVKEKNLLRLKLDDLGRQNESSLMNKSSISQVNKTAGFAGDLNSQQLENLKFKVKTLEKTNLNLLKEVRQYKDA